MIETDRSINRKQFIPGKPWQGSQSIDLRLRIPCDVVMICKLTGIEPEKLIKDFLTTLALEKSSKVSQAAKDASVEYFVRSSYGNQFYSEDEIRQMFRELQNVQDLWLEDTSSKFIDHHSRWLSKYWKQWFKRWYNKVRRKSLPLSTEK
jgi:hypothetical protein